VMAVIPPPSHSTVRRIYELHAAKEDRQPRPYLGASQIGEACALRLWLSFRWCGAEAFDGRMLRLFKRGEQEEAQLLDELRAVGVQISGEQYGVEACGGHFRGHLDGAGLGFEEGPKTWAVIEIKTSNSKGFAAIQSKGCQIAKPLHWAQVQVYMGLTGMERAMYFVTNKETDEIYSERIHFDKDGFAALIARAAKIIFAPEPPARISEDPAWYECKFCPFHAQCHGEARPRPTCRSCAHSTPTETGAWSCEFYGQEMDVESQRASDHCPEHRYIPSLIERVAELVSIEGNSARWLNKLTGKTFDQPGYDSREMFEAQDFRCIGDDYVQEYKTVFGAETRVAAPSAEPTVNYYWQTFKNGTRHIRKHIDMRFAGYVAQTEGQLLLMASLGNPKYSGDDEHLIDDLPWGNDGQGKHGGDAIRPAKRSGKTRGNQRELPVV
jgi:hypothetical protein